MGDAEARRHWGVTSAQLPAAMVAGQARQLEDLGLEGVFAGQVYGPPFLPLAAAATSTERLLLASGVALAFARSPFETAMAALDMDRLSGGRFVLGLGPSIRAWSEGIFGQPYGKPLPHLREVVEAVRMIVAGAHTGELDRYDGEYVRLDFSELQPTPPPVRTEIPVWIAALRGPLVRLAAEIADGVIGHPLWSVRWATEEVPAWIEEGLGRADRHRRDVEVNVWVFAAPNPDPDQSLEHGRATMAFYGGMAQYEEYFAAHGFRDAARALQEGVQRGDYLSVASQVPDEMVRTFVLCGTPEQCRAQLEPVWAVADSVTVVPPVYGLGPDELLRYAMAISETFHVPAAP
ncbi:MAG: LLM class flavin-dependent oxidoreductase [Acidimicrobiia bacterium]|nr:LLM class flavin-dependent oxidoreductase [Acidimicrobiia bacterium]